MFPTLVDIIESPFVGMIVVAMILTDDAPPARSA
jgi:hypothetical protein